MTAKEMYIRITNDLQSLGAQRSRRYGPEQIELEINTEIENFVKDAVKENPRGFFTVEEEYYGGVQPLIEEKWLPVYTAGGSYSCDLPSRYSHLLGIGTKALTACRPVAPEDYQAKTTTYAVAKVPISPLNTPLFYRSVTFSLNGNTAYSRTTDGYSTNDPHLIIEELTSNLAYIYYEQAQQYSKPGYLILKIGSTFTGASLVIDGQTVTFTQDKQITRNQLNPSSDVGNLMPVRRVKNQNAIETNATAYYRPSTVELPSTVQQGQLQIFAPKNLIVNSVYCNYIRRPRKISLSLNIGSDLDQGIHGLICDRTVTRIRERIGDPKFQTGIIQENK